MQQRRAVAPSLPCPTKRPHCQSVEASGEIGVRTLNTKISDWCVNWEKPTRRTLVCAVNWPIRRESRSNSVPSAPLAGQRTPTSANSAAFCLLGLVNMMSTWIICTGQGTSSWSQKRRAGQISVGRWPSPAKSSRTEFNQGSWLDELCAVESAFTLQLHSWHR